MAEGTLRWLNETTGYGLIRPDGRGRNLFVRSMDIVIDEAEQPLEQLPGVFSEIGSSHPNLGRGERLR
jgi:cold shock CspA family protein